jgi:uncharacterized repeat protein (TIGR02543 family)
MLNKILLVLLLSVSTLCNYYNNNPLDEKGSNYDPPIILIDSIHEKDTLLLNTAVFVLRGNRPQSRFKIQIGDSSLFDEWVPEGTYTLSNLKEDTYSVCVSTMYNGGTLVFYDTVTFYVRLIKDTIKVEIKKPHYAINTDTVITGSKPITLIGSATGTPQIQYTWFSADSQVFNKDTFLLENKYDSLYCIAANDSGSDTSRTFILKLNSMIRGSIIDTAEKKLDGVKVTLNESDTTLTSSQGEFIFKELPSGAYTVKFHISGYYDTTLSNLAVNNDDTIIKNVTLKSIDTTIIDTTVIDTTVIDTPPKDTTYRVVYKGNGNDSGVIPVDTISYHVGDSVLVLAGTHLLKKDCNFSGWTTTLSDSLITFIPGESFRMVKGNVILIAQWVAKSLYVLSYDGNSSTGGFLPPNTTYIEGMSAKVPSEGTLDRTGHHFLCWNTDKNPSNGIDYMVGNTILMEENITLYARWEKNIYRLTYISTYQDAGDIPPSSIQEYESEIVIAIPSLVRTGFSFRSWNTNSNGTGKNYTPGATTKMGADSLTLYAQWNNPTGMILIPSKNQTFSMGSKIPVTFTKNFWCDTTEVIQKEFDDLMSATYPTIYQKPNWDDIAGDDYPAYNTSWYVAALYCNARTKSTGSTDTVYVYKEIEGEFINCNLSQLVIDYSKKGFRLPTDAEYEFAAKGGSTIEQYSSDQLMNIAWFSENSAEKPHRVAQKKKNGYGLHDILGNLYEWGNELYYNYPEQSELLVDPVHVAPIDPRQDNNKWIYRGGSYQRLYDEVNYKARYFKTSGNGKYDTGFRCYLPIQE